MPDPKRNTAFTFSLSLVETAARPNFKANPTLAAGDFKVSIDGGAFNNLASLPTVAPASGRNVEVALSSSEMNGDRIVVQAVDAAGAEWDEVMVAIQTTVSTTDEIKTETASIQADTNDIQTRLPAALVGGRIDASVGAVAANAITAASIATGAIDADALAADAVDEIWDEVVDGATTARETMRLANSANGGKVSGGGTTNVLIRDLADTKNRINATVDANGNRTAITRDLT